MHGEQLVGTYVLPFPMKGSNHKRPGTGGDTTPVLPLLNSPPALADVSGHLGDGVPAGKYVQNVLHAGHSVGDGLSRQVGTTIPVTETVVKRTICPHMGRGTTSTSTKKGIAARLKAGRIAAGFGTQAALAKELGIELERYKKWESGRTPIPAEFVAAVCQAIDKDANYLFNVPAVGKKSAAA